MTRLRASRAAAASPRRQRPAPRISLTLRTSGYAPGYRDLSLIVVDASGREYDLRLRPQDVQSLIFDCASVTKQINDHPPLDWDQYPATIMWPAVTPWKEGTKKDAGDPR